MNDDRESADKRVEAEADDNDSTSSQGSQSVGDEVNEDTLRNAVGAYLLDALPESERSAFESYLARSPDTQEELRQLAPVVALLRKLLDLDSTNGATEQSPPAELRAEILRVVKAEQSPRVEVIESANASDAAGLAVSERKKIIRTAPESTGPLGPARAQGRIRSGVATTPGARPAPTPISLLSRAPKEWLVAAALLVIAVGGIFWALALQSRIDSKNREIAAQSAEIALLRQNANASAYTLSASTADAAAAGGTLLFSLRDQIGVLYVHDLPRLDDDSVYQLWYLDDDVDGARPGGTFTVHTNGNGTIVVASDTPTYDAIALTEEPEGGSQGPTTAILLQGVLGGVAG